ncbi:MAG: hypothetical protein KDB29_10740, partial [Planctomycetes bacterium]|nr:hypothetical protein [Planctomycetota bacterium]
TYRAMDSERANANCPTGPEPAQPRPKETSKFFASRQVRNVRQKGKGDPQISQIPQKVISPRLCVRSQLSLQLMATMANFARDKIQPPRRQAGQELQRQASRQAPRV